ARLFGSVANAHAEYLTVAIPAALGVALLLYLRSHRLNVIGLGRESAVNLGIDYQKEMKLTLGLISILSALSTALVGPMTFLGFLVVTIAYQAVGTFDHRCIFPAAFLIAFVILSGAYFCMKNIFYAEGVVSIIIELVGGSVFLIHILRKGRL
ncbi:MAG: iron chelate uptake ABC transporter family permease subunit, partial [Propionibacteriaceae bacterium]